MAHPIPLHTLPVIFRREWCTRDFADLGDKQPLCVSSFKHIFYTPGQGPRSRSGSIAGTSSSPAGSAQSSGTFPRRGSVDLGPAAAGRPSSGNGAATPAGPQGSGSSGRRKSIGGSSPGMHSSVF